MINVNVIPNGLEKYIAFTVNNNNLVFINIMQFMDFSLDALVKNFSGNNLNISRKNLVVIC